MSEQEAEYRPVTKPLHIVGKETFEQRMERVSMLLGAGWSICTEDQVWLLDQWERERARSDEYAARFAQEEEEASYWRKVAEETVER